MFAVDSLLPIHHRSIASASWSGWNHFKVRRTKGERISEGSFTWRGGILAIDCHALSAAAGCHSNDTARCT